MNVLLWSLIAFLSGSIPYSVLVGYLSGAGDIRRVGDHNPGATNVGKATNWRWFTLAMLLDGFKGAIPVGFAWFGGYVTGWEIIPIALAPLLGHAYSPWLKFRGGKALATTFGVWAGLTMATAPIVLGLLMGLMYAVLAVSGWAVMLAFFLLGGLIVFTFGVDQPAFSMIWLLNLLLLAWRYRADLRQKPRLRAWLHKKP